MQKAINNKKRRNLSAYEFILISNNSIREITANNGKLLQPITEPKGIHQPNDVIDDFTSLTI